MTRPFPPHALALGAALTAACAVGWMFLSTPSVTTASGSGDAVAGTDARTGLLHRLFGGGDAAPAIPQFVTGLENLPHSLDGTDVR